MNRKKEMAIYYEYVIIFIESWVCHRLSSEEAKDKFRTEQTLPKRRIFLKRYMY